MWKNLWKFSFICTIYKNNFPITIQKLVVFALAMGQVVPKKRTRINITDLLPEREEFKYLRPVGEIVCTTDRDFEVFFLEINA